MTAVLLVYILTAVQAAPPEYPNFFTVYRTHEACSENAKRYTAINGKVNMLIKAVCVDARDPSLVPYLHDVPELEEMQPEQDNNIDV